jgi:hypothetical protein
MKVGLESCPTIHDLEAAYNQILNAKRNRNGEIDVNSFALYCQWGRFDARLSEVCVEFLTHFWKQMNPIKLHDAFVCLPWPAVLGVLLEFCPQDSTLFQMWKKTATCDFEKVDWELFFIGKRRIGGRSMFDDARFSLDEYRRWGYLSREVLVNKGGRTQERGPVFSYAPETRIQILKELLETHSRITTGQYWEALGKSISKRQAERDLGSSNLLKKSGRTKGRYFVRRVTS